MPAPSLDLWTLVRKRPQIDPGDLAEAVRAEVVLDLQEYRARLLIRDSLNALRSHWGEKRYQTWLKNVPEGAMLEAISDEDFEEIGYPSLPGRLMDKTEPDDLRQFLIELGRLVHREQRIDLAGSGALILTGHLIRHTDDIDVVGDVPEEIRNQHQALDFLKRRYGLYVGHVQTHYFPDGWQGRAQWLDSFGRLQVYVLDLYDIALSKLFSARTKDIDDLRVLRPELDRETLTRRLKETAQRFLAEPTLVQKAKDNWELLYGAPLPT